MSELTERATGDRQAPGGVRGTSQAALSAACASEVGLVRSRAARLLLALYGRGGARVRTWVLRLAERLEGGPYYSATIREILRRHHGVSVGAYSYGDCLTPGALPAGVTVGRYCSISRGTRVYLRNHPLDRLSMHPFFYNKAAGFVGADTIETGTLAIGHDVWIGAGVIITPGCTRVGTGAVLGCGAVVTRDVEEFAVVAGNPARLLRYRFPEELRREILRTRWWEKPVEELAADMEHMVRPLGESVVQHPCLARRGGASE